MRIKMKMITYLGKESILACDGRCDLAWGCNGGRYKDNDYGWPDSEMGPPAPADPGTCEGGDSKPLDGKLNKWCARECERASLTPTNADQIEIELPEFLSRAAYCQCEKPQRPLYSDTCDACGKKVRTDGLRKHKTPDCWVFTIILWDDDLYKLKFSRSGQELMEVANSPDSKLPDKLLALHMIALKLELDS